MNKKEAAFLDSDMLLKYASLQQACLYAHFAPVSLINHGKLLSDMPDDGLGTGSIAKRIAKTGEDKFYRVEYHPNPDKAKKISSKAKRKKDKTFVSENADKLLPTSIVNKTYIKNVIEAYVNGNTKIEDGQLYHEPEKTKR